MAKINILFNGAEYAIDKANLAPATNALKAHLETLGGGGIIEPGKEYQFKSIITADEFNSYCANATPIQEGQYFISGTAKSGWMLAVLAPTAFMLSEGSIGTTSGNAYICGWETFAGMGVPVTSDGWYYLDSNAETATPLNEPPFVTIDLTEASANAETTSVFFDLGGTSGDLDITLDGAVYKVDSAKLAPATNSFIAHLETLKGGESGGAGLEYGKEYRFKPNLTMDDFAAYVKDATASMAIGNGGIYDVVEARKIGEYSDGVKLSYWGGGEIEPGVSFEPCAILQILNSNLQKDYRYVINASVAGEVFGGASVYVDGDGWYSSNYGEKVTKTGEVGKYTIPADVAMANTLENTAILFDIPSAGGSGVIEYGKTYTFKSDLTKETLANFVTDEAVDTEMGPGVYKIAYDASTVLMYMYDGTDGYVYFVDMTGGGVSQYIYMFEARDLNGVPAPKGWGLISDADMTITSVAAPAYTVPENPDTTFTMEEISVLFEVGGGSGNDGDTKIVINGTEHWIDSAKLADAKSALAAHLEALETASN